MAWKCVTVLHSQTGQQWLGSVLLCYIARLDNSGLEVLLCCIARLDNSGLEVCYCAA